ncbi:metallophosphoesterase [Gleimia hominis]|uniref:metallophosphoesterase n=1 Tax=Gleimia hominis TaxID=595468 RepID=UPI000C803876|nr:metallophosphoesterase [Gleimia hominis]WIK64043.1 metallophosphoesterase [Gleimia hominis]
MPKKPVLTRFGYATAAVAATAVAGLAWTQVERRWPTVRHVDARGVLPTGAAPVRVLHVSDLHLFPGQDFLVDFVRSLAELEFDFVVSTGDNFGSTRGLPMLRRAYEPLLGHPGAFVFGSNDYYSPQPKPWHSYLVGSRRHAFNRVSRTEPDLPWQELEAFFHNAGWVNLNNRAGHVRLEDGRTLALMGVDDPHIHRDHMPVPNADWNAPEALRIALLHAPYQRVLNEFVHLGAQALFAGHTHGGQLRVPSVGAIVSNCDVPRDMVRGLHRWYSAEGSAVLNVSAGLGTSMYAPVRFACRPEVSLVTLHSA